MKLYFSFPSLILLATVASVGFGCSTTVSNNNKSNTDNVMTQKTIHLTKAEFLAKVANYEATEGEFKYLGEKPCLLDFYATWCGPCKTIAPILEELAEQYKDQIYIYKIDTEKEPELAAAFGIRSIPTLIFVPMEGQPQLVQGALPKEQLAKAIEDILIKK